MDMINFDTQNYPKSVLYIEKVRLENFTICRISFLVTQFSFLVRKNIAYSVFEVSDVGLLPNDVEYF